MSAFHFPAISVSSYSYFTPWSFHQSSTPYRYVKSRPVYPAPVFEQDACRSVFQHLAVFNRRAI